MTETTSSPDQAPPDIVPVSHWGSTDYRGEIPAGDRFLMEVVDKREQCGQLYIDVGAEDGDTDDILTASFEISNLPGSRTHTQAMHLHFNDNAMAMTVFKQGDKYILRPETNVTILPTVLPNGELAFIVESIDG
jgi:hypothetical protein